jgi:hypothetical protein
MEMGLLIDVVGVRLLSFFLVKEKREITTLRNEDKEKEINFLNCNFTSWNEHTQGHTATSVHKKNRIFFFRFNFSH